MYIKMLPDTAVFVRLHSFLEFADTGEELGFKLLLIVSKTTTFQSH